jgi:TfoX/Sxy family transcriptional regulator of competence genes
MASDPVLVARLHALLGARAGVEPRKMFGGVCFFLNGNMCVGVHNENLILRVGETAARELLTRAHVRPMDLTGKPMKGWATVLSAAIESDAALAEYVALAADFVASLPKKA